MIDSSPYSFKDFPGSSHRLLIRAVRRTSRRGGTLVDVGAAGGELARFLADDFDRLIGIEGDPARVPDLGGRFDAAFVADLNHLLRLPEADAYVLADILEHLPRPDHFLALVRAALPTGGRIYVSVPNVANVTVRIGLLFGRWNYSPQGILDRSHLRFFTRRTILEELKRAGFSIVRTEATTMPIRLVLDGRIPNPILAFGERLLLAVTRTLPTLLGYQWVITAERD